MAPLEQTTQTASSIQTGQGQLFTGDRVQNRKSPDKRSLGLETQKANLGSEWALVWTQVPLVGSSSEKNSQCSQASALWKDANSSLFGDSVETLRSQVSLKSLDEE